MWKVLVVEDDPMLAEIHKRYIESNPDFSCVAIAHDAKEAFHQIEKTNPDLIFLDVYLPQMTGLDFLKALRASERQIDVILITAARAPEQVETAYRYGAVDYLIKPFEFSRLNEALEAYKHRKRLAGKEEILDQKSLDEIYRHMSIKADSVLPKGLHERTLERVRKCIDQFSKPVTIEEIAEVMEMSKVTLRRYLEYMEKAGDIDIQMSYGLRGRPSYTYMKKGFDK